MAGWGERPTLVVLGADEEPLVKSFRNLDKVLVNVPEELEVASPYGRARCFVSEAALPLVLGRAGVTTRRRDRVSLHPDQVLLAPVVSERATRSSPPASTRSLHEDAHKTQIRQAVEELFEVKVASVNIIKVQSSWGAAAFVMAGGQAGRRPSWSYGRATRSRSSRGRRLMVLKKYK
jgi:large subunit ribosomal protein L23